MSENNFVYLSDAEKSAGALDVQTQSPKDTLLIFHKPSLSGITIIANVSVAP